jgi:hypothetical protein
MRILAGFHPSKDRKAMTILSVLDPAISKLLTHFPTSSDTTSSVGNKVMEIISFLLSFRKACGLIYPVKTPIYFCIHEPS